MADEPKINADDLDLIDPSLADSDKSAEDLWNEIAAEEGEDKTVTAAAADADGDDATNDPGDDRPDTTTSAKPKGDAAEAGTPDPWASAPEELRAAYEAERARSAELEQKARSAEGRAKAHQRKLEDLRRAMEKSKSPEMLLEAQNELRRVENEYPEVTQPLKKALGAITDRITAEEEGRARAARTEFGEIIRTETAKLAERHPDWDTFLKQHGGPAFAAWVDDQPRRIREALAVNGDAIVDADGAIALIDAYKQHLGVKPAAAPASVPSAVHPTHNPLADRRQRQLAATATPNRSGGRPTVSGIPEDGDPQAIWDAFEAEEQRRRA